MWKSVEESAKGTVAHQKARQSLFDVFSESENLPPDRMAERLREGTALLNEQNREAASLLRELSDGCSQVMGSILQLLAAFTAKLPVGGFFQRAPADAFPAFCRLLGGLEERERALRRAVLRLSSFSQNRLAVAHGSCLCDLAEASGVSDQLLRGWREAASLALRYHADADRLARFLTDYCRDVLTPFCEKSGIAADLENDGANFRVASVAQLCGELRAATKV